MPMHRLRLRGPSGSSASRGTHDDPTRFRPKFHFLGQLSSIEQQLGHPNTTGIPDSHDSGLGGHVITV